MCSGLNSDPPKDISTSESPEPYVTKDVIKDLERRHLPWIAPNAIRCVSIKERQREFRDKRGGHVTTEVGIEVMLPQPQECQQPQEAGKMKDLFSPQASGGSTALPTPWFWTFSLQRLENKNKHLLFKHPVCVSLLQQP